MLQCPSRTAGERAARRRTRLRTSQYTSVPWCMMASTGGRQPIRQTGRRWRDARCAHRAGPHTVCYHSSPALGKYTLNNRYNCTYRIDTVGTTVRYLRHTRSEMYQASQLVERVATTINSGVIDARSNRSAYNCRRGGCIDDKRAKPNYRPPSMHLPATHGRGFNECFY